jgi:hypothetical protein
VSTPQTTIARGRPIVAGYEWRQRVRAQATVPLFPAGVALTGQIRANLADASPLATLSTGAGSITRIDDDTIELVLAGADSAAWAAKPVVLDFVRTDTSPDVHLGFRLTIPVVRPVTRGLP